jgi:hypothetical protein
MCFVPLFLVRFDLDLRAVVSVSCCRCSFLVFGFTIVESGQPSARFPISVQEHEPRRPAFNFSAAWSSILLPDSFFPSFHRSVFRWSFCFESSGRQGCSFASAVVFPASASSAFRLSCERAAESPAPLCSSSPRSPTPGFLFPRAGVPAESTVRARFHFYAPARSCWFLALAIDRIHAPVHCSLGEPSLLVASFAQRFIARRVAAVILLLCSCLLRSFCCRPYHQVLPECFSTGLISAWRPAFVFPAPFSARVR